MTGEKFLRGLITPIDPKNIFFMLQAGYPADFILGLTVESLNGVRNRSVTAGAVREADADFVRMQQLLRDVQAAGGVGMRVEEDKAKGSTAVLFFQRDDLPADIREKATVKVEWISGGQAQRVAVARALINNPSVIIADEPTAHLDTTLSLELVNILGKLKEDGKTVLIASHDALVSESKIVDNVIHLRDGKIDGQNL